MDMIQSRNLTSHAYNEETAKAVLSAIVGSYFAEFLAFHSRMQKLKEEQI